MKVGSTYSGFVLKKEKNLKDINSVARIFEHKKNGAKLLHLKNDDDNKVFSIAFKTPPYDDTGLPHILEHSVLCGSKNFPTKDPFLELSKTSLKTFLNAFTYPDKTVYPVASKNKKDFHNLMNVYLDAVFYPNIYEKPEIFKQEAWHYHLKKENEKLSLNGVVYSEMKGAYSSPERKIYEDSCASLYSDTCYKFSSGGDPEKIPNLTYERFLNFHKDYYHPSNAFIYLYGDLDIKSRLKFLNDSYLSKFTKNKKKITFGTQEPFKKLRKEVSKYSISEQEEGRNKVYFSLNYAIKEDIDKDMWLTLRILVYYLINIKSSPLKKALLDKNVGEDVFGHFEDDIMAPYVSFIVKNSSLKKEEDFLNIVNKTLEQLLKNGLNKDLLQGCINTFEFRFREADFGSYPKGLVYNLEILKTWLYEQDPLRYISLSSVFFKLRKLAQGDYFEKVMGEYFLKNTHRSLVVLKPEKGLLEKKEVELEKKLDDYKNNLGLNERKRLVNETLDLEKYQKKEDSLEDKKKIPGLKIGDVKRKMEVIPTKKKVFSDSVFLFNPLDTRGICYLSLVFNTKVVPYEKLHILSLFSELLGRVNTKKHTYEELDILIKKYTGGCFFRRKTYASKLGDDDYTPVFSVGGKVVVGNVVKLLEILFEIMFESKYDDKKRIKNVLKEVKSRIEMRINTDGSDFAAMRLMSYFSEQGKYNEYMNGITFYHFLCDLLENFDERWDCLVEDLESLPKIIFNKNLLVGNIVCENNDFGFVKDALEKKISKLSSSRLEAQNYYFNIKGVNEGLLTQSSVQYVAQGANFRTSGYRYTGKLSVLQNILNGEYLWDELRVKGGAYGGYCSFGLSGNSFFASYRDPNLKRTLEVYRGVPKFLRGFKSENMDKFIIGTIGRLDMPLTPSMKGDRVLNMHFSKLTNDDLQEQRNEVLATTVEDVQKFGDLMESVISKNLYCVLGNESAIQKEKKLFKSLLSVAR